ncbi:MAG: histidine phosphatase family protein [Pseudomonadales bacterium]
METGREEANGEEPSREGNYGDAALALMERTASRGARHSVVLMRHSAREYAPGRHDLDNPLTAQGRAWALAFGQGLPKECTVRGYASPPERCMETAALILDGHRREGGAVTRHRPVEALGVFYALDQMKMWKAMQAAGGLAPFVSAWVRDEAPADALMPAGVAARLLLRVLEQKLRQPVAERQIDVCVSHDMTLYLMREVLLGEPATLAEVAYLDALVLFEDERGLWFASHHGEPRRVDAVLS